MSILSLYIPCKGPEAPEAIPIFHHDFPPLNILPAHSLRKGCLGGYWLASSSLRDAPPLSGTRRAQSNYLVRG